MKEMEGRKEWSTMEEEQTCWIGRMHLNLTHLILILSTIGDDNKDKTLSRISTK